MLSNYDYVKQSLDINLFFLRILKEHAVFIEASLPSKNFSLTEQARMLNKNFEILLNKAVHLSYNIIPLNNDMATKYTYEAEKATSFLTGIPINTSITKTEMSLGNKYNSNNVSPRIVNYVYNLNNNAIKASKDIIKFKTYILDNVLTCNLFTANYPLLIEHIIREANFYVNILKKLQNRTATNVIEDALKQEAFWNQIMAEHSKFIRGLLDPSEDALFDISNEFGNEFDELTEEALNSIGDISTLPKVTKESKEATERLRNFKAQGTEGILDCKIKSIILPLLGDHVLREANHYLILLDEYTKES
ncbi:DUF2935 domain-containing protein [Tepidibacter aestuarii]|uniref:DUF2935 domain-containing protein n=1 Tax=Tepidibacter aestuarii TaxID=2925782 RepID=UPI0020BE3FA0|nr:DUF2935 domain-containing protein [Tepidibacter aestuarii]CAH2215436.1 conserved protein of unknown function [Tepidibacter aestuarii]